MVNRKVGKGVVCVGDAVSARPAAIRLHNQYETEAGGEDSLSEDNLPCVNLGGTNEVSRRRFAFKRE